MSDIQAAPPTRPNGFNGVVIVLLLVIIGLLGGITWFMYSQAEEKRKADAYEKRKAKIEAELEEMSTKIRKENEFKRLMGE